MVRAFFKNYSFSLFLIASVIIGSVLGLIFKEKIAVVKPLGDIFLNLLFTVVVPLVFFSISSAVCSMGNSRRLGRILFCMLGVFIFTGIISSLLMVAGVMAFSPAQGISISVPSSESIQPGSVADRIVAAFTVKDFNEILSRKNMLALIVISVLMGLAAGAVGEKGRAFREFLHSGSAVMMKVVGFIMWYAPIGLGAYFAYLTGVFGEQLMGTYAKAMALYYPLAFGYFFIGFSFYAFMAGGVSAIKTFWVNISETALTALGTGSSAATIPVNLQAAKRIGIPEDVRELVIPIGATIHMDGSCLAAILKIAVLFGVFGMEFSGISTIATAIGVAILCGVVMSGIPGGGFLGEMLIVTLYGFPPEALPIASMIGTLVDPPATMVNAVGDNVSGMMVARVVNGKNWQEAYA